MIPKIFGAAAYLGGLLSAAAIVSSFYLAAPQAANATADDWRQLTYTLRPIFLFVAVPGLTLAMLCGVLLLWHSRWTLLRMRWMRLKLAVLAASIPLLHLFMSSRLEQVRASGEGGSAMTQFNIGLGAAIVLAALVIFLGRHKPRLAQPVRPMVRKTGRPAARPDSPEGSTPIQTQQGGS